MTMDYTIETQDLTKQYGNLVAVNKLNIKVQHNTIHGFLGPNGAGKSTTIKILIGLLKATSGAATVLGKKVQLDDADSRLRIGYMPELPRFPKHLKGAELLDIYGRMYGMNPVELKEQISKLIELVGLKGRENDLIGKYSKGMQQRIGIAQALLTNPELVILDEPSMGLDPVGMVEVRELVKAISKDGMTVLVSSHLLFEVEQICSHVTIINRGQALVSDTLENVSHKISGPVSIQVEIVNLNQKVISSLKELPFVKEITQKNATLNINLNTREEVREKISQTITSSGGIIVSMSMKGHGLEDIFLELIKSQGAKK